MMGRWTLDTSPIFLALDLAARMFSPYDLNPRGANPMRDILTQCIDFARLAQSPIRLFVTATNVRTGAPVYFDSLQHPITSAHIMAGASLPPSFPPTEIDGEYYWDGAVVSNSPMQYVIDDASRNTALVFQVDLWDANGEVPLDIVIREKSDSGSPVVATAPDTPHAQYYRDIAMRVRDGLAVSSRPTPKIVIEA